MDDGFHNSSYFVPLAAGVLLTFFQALCFDIKVALTASVVGVIACPLIGVLGIVMAFTLVMGAVGGASGRLAARAWCMDRHPG